MDGRLSGDVLMLEILKEYGWDYHTYLSQPSWLEELAQKKFIVESKLRASATATIQKNG